jgi:HSP20 family molecular chaperone IbpA
LVRIIPLPENVHLEQLRVQLTPRGLLVVKAPFLMPGVSVWQQKQLHRFAPTWVPIRVTLKDCDLFQLQGGLFNKKCSEEYQGQQWNKQTKKNIPEQDIFQHTTGLTTTTAVTNLLRPQFIRDEVTGKLAMHFKVNTMGFRPEEIRVVAKDGVLIVEATTKRSTKSIKEITKLGLPVKYLHREFVLPQFVDEDHIAYRVLNNGILTIKLPILKTKQINMQTRNEADIEEQQMLDWQKPMCA